MGRKRRQVPFTETKKTASDTFSVHKFALITKQQSHKLEIMRLLLPKYFYPLFPP